MQHPIDFGPSIARPDASKENEPLLYVELCQHSLFSGSLSLYFAFSLRQGSYELYTLVVGDAQRAPGRRSRPRPPPSGRCGGAKGPCQRPLRTSPNCKADRCQAKPCLSERTTKYRKVNLRREVWRGCSRNPLISASVGGRAPSGRRRLRRKYRSLGRFQLPKPSAP
jgi:hypothetical protein